MRSQRNIELGELPRDSRRAPRHLGGLLADEKGKTAAAFLRRAAAWFASMGITVQRVLSDNGACYRSRAHAEACSELGMRHLFTRP